MSSAIRCRWATFGTGPVAVCTLSAMCCGLLVSVSTQVTVRFARMYFSENSAHVLQSNSAAQSGTGRSLSLSKYVPFMNGRLIKTASPWSAASGRIRFSDPRSVIEEFTCTQAGCPRFQQTSRCGGLLPLQEPLELLVEPRLGDGDADVARLAGGLELFQRRPVHVEVGEAEDLHKIELLALIVLLRVAELRETGVFADLVDLRRDEQLVAHVRQARDAAESGIVARIARPGIDELAAVGDERSEHRRDPLLADLRDLADR